MKSGTWWRWVLWVNISWRCFWCTTVTCLHRCMREWVNSERANCLRDGVETATGQGHVFIVDLGLCVCCGQEVVELLQRSPLEVTLSWKACRKPHIHKNSTSLFIYSFDKPFHPKPQCKVYMLTDGCVGSKPLLCCVWKYKHSVPVAFAAQRSMVWFPKNPHTKKYCQCTLDKCMKWK